MSKERKNLSPQKTFAVAYRIFTTLTDAPKRSSEYAEKFSMSVDAIKSVVRQLSRLGCIVAKRGGGKQSGIRKLPGVTVEDLFNKFNLPYREGDVFEKEIDVLLAKGFGRPKKCTVCEKRFKTLNKEWLCDGCVVLNSPLYENKRLAKCGHYSSIRYFECEICKPELDDNTTPDDFGCGLTLMA